MWIWWQKKDFFFHSSLLAPKKWNFFLSCVCNTCGSFRSICFLSLRISAGIFMVMVHGIFYQFNSFFPFLFLSLYLSFYLSLFLSLSTFDKSKNGNESLYPKGKKEKILSLFSKTENVMQFIVSNRNNRHDDDDVGRKKKGEKKLNLKSTHGHE